MMVVFKMRDGVPSARYSSVLMYYVNGEFGSSLLIESTDSMICSLLYSQLRVVYICNIYEFYACSQTSIF